MAADVCAGGWCAEWVGEGFFTAPARQRSAVGGETALLVEVLGEVTLVLDALLCCSASTQHGITFPGTLPGIPFGLITHRHVKLTPLENAFLTHADAGLKKMAAFIEGG